MHSFIRVFKFNTTPHLIHEERDPVIYPNSHNQHHNHDPLATTHASFTVIKKKKKIYTLETDRILLGNFQLFNS